MLVFEPGDSGSNPGAGLGFYPFSRYLDVMSVVHSYLFRIKDYLADLPI